MAKRRKVEPTHQPTLFEMDKLATADDHVAKINIERPYLAPALLLGTSSFTATGWQGTFYPKGMKSSDYLTYYASIFQTVEIDSTYYGPPSVSTVTAWRDKTPADFVFAAKVPQVITHEKVLVDCDTELHEFIEVMGILGDRLGPLVFQFPFFDRWKFPKQETFLTVLEPFLKKLPTSHKFAIEIRNKVWIDTRFCDLLRQHRVALVLQDLSSMPRPWEYKENFDFVTADFVYVRWLGDRKRIEEQTKTWGKTVVDRRGDLVNWVELFRQFVSRDLKVFAYANNHYAGNGPETVKLFWELYDRA
jgi:uncharacterized protein YecE (DUF72 family)